MSALLNVVSMIFLRTLGTLVSFLPRSTELSLGRGLGALIALAGYRRKVMRENIRNCFPHYSEHELKQLQKKNYQHLGILLLELFHFFSVLPDHYKNYVSKNSRMNGLENWKKAQQQNKGAIFVASHLGNWELMVACGSLSGIPITMITKHLKPAWLHKMIERARSSTGVKPAYEPRTLPAVMRALRDNEAVGFVMDQYAGPPMGIPVQFFGVKVGTLSAVATLVNRTSTMVVPALTHRDNKGIIQIDLEEALDLREMATDIEKTTEFLAQKVEKWVRAYPEQWLWTHRRFKNVVWPANLK